MMAIINRHNRPLCFMGVIRNHKMGWLRKKSGGPSPKTHWCLSHGIHYIHNDSMEKAQLELEKHFVYFMYAMK